jgi:deazaflavin-dependent oxidoreductase (nitroreductase family)
VRYIKPTGADAAFNKIVGLLTGAGISVMGSRVLAVKGRKSGQWRTVPVNLLIVDGARYLVAPRGETEWVRNIRVAGGGELRLGRKREPITVAELPNTEKPLVIREYLRRWGWEVGKFFEGLTRDATDEQIMTVAPGFPVFRVG